MLPRDEKVLTALRQIRQEGGSPSVRELGRRAEVASPSAVHASLRRLEQEGKITLSRRNGRVSARSIRLTEDDGKEWYPVPLITRLDALTGRTEPPTPVATVFFRLEESEKAKALAFRSPSDEGEIHRGDVVIFLRAQTSQGLSVLSLGGALGVGVVTEREDGTYVSVGSRTFRLGGEADIASVGRIRGFIREYK